jgi:hypothetical protein
MTERAVHTTRREPTAPSAGATPAGRPAPMTVGTPEAQHGIGAPAPLDTPALTSSEWAQVRRALAGTDDDELPVFGRFPA